MPTNNNNQSAQSNTQGNTQTNTQVSFLNNAQAQTPSSNTTNTTNTANTTNATTGGNLLPSFGGGGGFKFNNPTTTPTTTTTTTTTNQPDQNKSNPILFNNQPKPQQQQPQTQTQTQTQPTSGGLLFNKDNSTNAQVSGTVTPPLSTTTGSSSTPLFNKSDNQNKDPVQNPSSQNQNQVNPQAVAL